MVINNVVQAGQNTGEESGIPAGALALIIFGVIAIATVAAIIVAVIFKSKSVAQPKAVLGAATPVEMHVESKTEDIEMTSQTVGDSKI